MSELKGTDWNDTLPGTADDDTLSGAGGDDVLVASPGFDLIDGGTGVDTLEGLGNFGKYWVSRISPTSVFLRNYEDNTWYTVRHVEYFTFSDGIRALGDFVGITGTDRNDVLNGTNGNDTLDGIEGNDTMAGGLGSDDYHVDSSGDVIHEAANGGIDRVHATASSYVLSANVEALMYDGTASFTGIGNALDNSLSSGDGNDRLEGGAGDDHLSAGYGDDTLLGGAGDDGITASGGNDLFDGGIGIDTVYLMAGRENYTIRRAGADGLVFTYTGEGDFDGNTLTVRNVESFGMAGKYYSFAAFVSELPADGNERIEGSHHNDRLDGFDGIDTLVGGAGDDTYVIRNAKTVAVELEDEGIDTAQVAHAGTAWRLPDFIEHGAAIEGKLGVSIIGNELANTLTGNGGANKLDGGAGNDTLDGGKGSDVLTGGSGNDTFYVDVAGDKVIELADEGIDTVITTLAKYTLAANVENLVYTGTSAFTSTGNALDNVITGGNGSNTIDGGAGNDTFVVSGAFAEYTRQRPNATDVVLVKGSQRITLKNIEQVQFADGKKTMGDIFYNIASQANDTLVGTDGNDTLDGLAGADQMGGGKGDDTYLVDHAGDTAIEQTGEGIDTVNVAIKAKATYTLADNVEHATITSTTAVSLVGNAEDNKLTGNAAANALAGGDGNDTLIGGKGNDTLTGGAGNDVYSVDAAGDKVIEAENGGYDIVDTTAAKYTLAANVEELRFTGTGTFTGIGNALDNVIIGGVGNDRLTGGAGADTFVIGAGNDTITDFASGIDRLKIDRAIGNGKGGIDGAVVMDAPGAFSSDAELVIFAQAVKSLKVADVAKAIGSATEAYANGDTALFALHDAKGTAVFLFTSNGEDAAVSSGELKQIATLTGVTTAGIDDYGLALA